MDEDKKQAQAPEPPQWRTIQGADLFGARIRRIQQLSAELLAQLEAAQRGLGR